MVDLSSEDSKIIFDPSFLSFDLLLQIVDVFLFVSQQKDEFLWKNIRLIDEVAKMGGLTAGEGHFRPGEVVSVEGVAHPLRADFIIALIEVGRLELTLRVAMASHRSLVGHGGRSVFVEGGKVSPLVNSLRIHNCLFLFV